MTFCSNNQTVISRFVHIAQTHPGNIAYTWHDGKDWHKVSYGELLTRVQAIAWVMKDAGVTAGSPVVLPAERHADLLAHMLAILYCGGFYVFLDPAYPAERQKFIIESVGASFGLCSAESSSLNHLDLFWIEPGAKSNQLSQPALPDQGDLPAYVMFTSGSTGEPKGVVVPHRAILRLVVDADFISFSPEQTFLQLSALSFDASTLEIWGPLLNGGTCVLHPEIGVPTLVGIRDVIRSQDVTTLWLTASLFNTFISEFPQYLAPVKQLLTGGEALSVPHVRKALEALPDTAIFNGYGPTENTTFTTVFPIPNPLPNDFKRIPIGYPISGTECAIVDENLALIEGLGTRGELVAFGDGLALGYLNHQTLTAEKFITITDDAGHLRTGYRTGDLVIRHEDNCYDYLSRIDKQIKIDGHRIEPGEIEYQLNSLSCVHEARVLVRMGPAGQKRLTAYVVGETTVDIPSIRIALASVLPSYMVPHFIIELTELPKNRNGKLDESSLPDPYAETSPVNDYPPELNARTQVLQSWRAVLNRSVETHTNFMDAGGTSLEALKLATHLGKSFGTELSGTFVFEYPSVEKQAIYLAGLHRPADSTKRRTSGQETAFAIIGIACRFPGARNVDEYWQNLLEGKETVRFFSDHELSPEISAEDCANPAYVRAKGIIDGYDQFDARFFGISPIEAKVMDPQQRIMLELSWHALEDAAIPPGDEQYRTGVFAGMNWARYYQQYVLPNKELVDSFGSLNCGLANEPDLLGTRVSYKLNLKGPSVNVFTACSTGLVAVAQACQSIENGQCEQAIAAGVSVSTPVQRGYLYQEGSMLSRDGHCRPFDENATGTTFNDGAGAVVLKRLDLAEQDGDNIYAVIKGFAVNNDGEQKASFTAPSVAGQIEVYNNALQRANIAPESVGFIETHGTATPLGDPIEVLSLRRCYSQGKVVGKNCAIGSVKSNIGHAIHAAGLASLIKATLAVRENKIPPTLFFKKANPKLELEKSRFFVNDVVESWKLPSPRRAAVTSLGVGGTNAHVLVEEHSATATQPQKPQEDSVHASHSNKMPIVVSAKSKESLDQQIARYQAFFAGRESTALRDVSFTTITGRKHFDFRAAAFGSSLQEALTNLSDPHRCARGKTGPSPNSQLGFLFSGQGTQAPQMGQWLYQNSADYRASFDAGCDVVLQTTGVDVRKILNECQDRTDNRINQTSFVQPALFLLEYGLARYLMGKGLKPDLLIGHSIGEYAAATLSGVFAFEDAVAIVAHRGALMQAMPPGHMLIVRADYEEIASTLAQNVELAAANAPGLIVLSGEHDAINDLSAELSSRNITNTLLETSHAFHSSMMDPVVAEFERLIADTNKQAPLIPIISTMTGTPLSAQQAISSSYWAQQLRRPVMFSSALQAVQRLQENNGEQTNLVEVGPGNTLVNLVGYHKELKGLKAFAALPGKGTDDKADDEIHRCIGQLWTAGYCPDWQHFFRDPAPRKIRLPGYAFAQDRHWLDPVQQATTGMAQALNTLTTAQTMQLTQEVTMDPTQHSEKIRAQVLDIIEDVSGYELGDADPESHFSEVGLDSLLLTQVATALERKFKLGITFRHLVESYTSLALIADHIAAQVEPEVVEAAAPTAPPVTGQQPGQALGGPTTMDAEAILSIGNGNIQDIVNTQLHIMQLQLQALGRHTPAHQAAQQADTSQSTASEANTIRRSIESDNISSTNADTDAGRGKPSHSRATRITREKSTAELTKAQKEWIEKLMARYQNKFPGSKNYTQKYRKHLADPRSVSGFNPAWKEIIFPIVTVESKGSKLRDIDGNEFIDTSNGFGPILFGHSPDFISDAAKAQIDCGIETGPQSPLAGEVAELVCELTGSERCTFACTGSEANVGALRIARTVTGRTKVVAFEGAYHGIHDEVIMRAGKNRQALPAAPGIPKEATANMILLPWGEQDSLDEIRQLGDQLAAVLVEPVQSRKPEFHSKEYLQELRRITSENGVALILDEVVTGFRVGPGGIRKRYDIDADITTYGKVIGGGYPIGIIAGKARFLDAMDGGQWQYGDDSIPEQGVTFFAGTFVRHPLALAVAKAVLIKIKEDGDQFYPDLEQKTANMATEAKSFIAEMNADVSFEEFASLFYISVSPSAQWGHLLFLSMVLDGIHIQQYRPNFLTTAHTETDIRNILKAFKSALANLIVNGLMEGDQVAAKKFLSGSNNIPPGARLGKNEHGEPAYFIEDPEVKGAYLEVGRP